MKHSKNSLRLAIVLFLLQIADGVCTYIGIQNFGPDVEGNPLIKHLSIMFGAGITLATIKSLTIIPIALLAKARAERILLFLVGLYIGVVIQWLLALYHHL